VTLGMCAHYEDIRRPLAGGKSLRFARSRSPLRELPPTSGYCFHSAHPFPKPPASLPGRRHKCKAKMCNRSRTG